jgi:hypothetical protein
MNKREAAEHFDYMQNIVPHEGVFELTEVAAHAEEVIFDFFLVLPVTEKHFSGALGGQTFGNTRQQGERFEGIHIGNRVVIIFPARPVEFAQAGGGRAAPCGYLPWPICNARRRWHG